MEAGSAIARLHSIDHVTTGERLAIQIRSSRHPPIPKKRDIGLRPDFCHNDSSCNRTPAYEALLSAS
jgi:hypothetical protein